MEQHVVPVEPRITVLDAQNLAMHNARSYPVADTINIEKSPGVHIGPKIVSVVQNIDNDEKVKDLPFHRYVVTVLKNTTRAERLSSALVVTVLITCIILIVYFSAFAAKNTREASDEAPHEWNITREMWVAEPFTSDEINSSYVPVRLVVINHSVSSECHTFVDCARKIKNIQTYFIDDKGYDIPYNFMVGNDGRIYEGRGFNIQGAHTFHYNRCSIGIGFIGDYRDTSTIRTQVTESQMNRTQILLNYAVENGYLHPKYVIVGHRDIYNSESPGTHLYNAIKQWEHYDNNLYRGMMCHEINEVSL